MNKTELIAQVAENAKVSKDDTATVIEATLKTIADTLAKGEKVQLLGFGTFETRKRSERMAKNPRTGEMVKVASSTVPAFKPGSALKKLVNN